MITGRTLVIPLLGYPPDRFKAPMIYNPWFEAKEIDAVVVPIGVEAPHYESVFRTLFLTSNVPGALVTMPHKVTTTRLVDEMTPVARIAGACNAVLRRADGSLLGENFDGAGFVRAVRLKRRQIAGARALVVGCGGVGSAIAAALAADGLAAISLFDVDAAAADALAGRLRRHFPALQVATGARDPPGHAIVVNATPLGMREADPLPLDPARIDAGALVAEVVMTQEFTPLLRAAQARGCDVQVGMDMLYEMIPLYLAFFGFGASRAEELREIAGQHRHLPAAALEGDAIDREGWLPE